MFIVKYNFYFQLSINEQYVILSVTMGSTNPRVSQYSLVSGMALLPDYIQRQKLRIAQFKFMISTALSGVISAKFTEDKAHMRPLQKHLWYWEHCNKNLVEWRGPHSEIFNKEFCYIMPVVSWTVLSANWPFMVGWGNLGKLIHSFLE